MEVRDVVAHDRHGVTSAGQLHVKDELTSRTEHHFGAGEIEFPHPAELLVIHGLDLVAVDLEALTPMGQGRGVMEPQKLEVSDPQAVLFHHIEYLGKRG